MTNTRNTYGSENLVESPLEGVATSQGVQANEGSLSSKNNASRNDNRSNHSRSGIRREQQVVREPFRCELTYVETVFQEYGLELPRYSFPPPIFQLEVMNSTIKIQPKTYLRRFQFGHGLNKFY